MLYLCICRNKKKLQNRSVSNNTEISRDVGKIALIARMRKRYDTQRSSRIYPSRNLQNYA